ncbi:MAG TPA: ABC transporter substrate-binding protein [Treponema sp.]|nr:ABC transporter substrate-binding protein [Treponema sp.]
MPKKTGRQKRTYFFTIVISLCLGAALLSLFFYFGIPLNKQVATKEYRIGVNENVKATPVLIADKQGFFRKAGVTVVVTRERIAASLLNGLFNGSYDFVCVPSFLAAQAYVLDKPIKVLAVVNRNQGRYLVMNPDFVENPKDLVGKAIGINPHNAAELVLSRFLILNGVNEDLVTINTYNDEVLVDMLASGQVAAILTWPPSLATAEKKMNGRVLITNAQMGEDMYWLLVTRNDIAEQEGIAIDAVFRALDNSYKLILRNPQKAKNIVSESLAVPLAEIEEEWRDFVFLLEMPQSLLLIMEQQGQWISKKYARAFDPSKLFSIYDYQHLNRVYPERVSIIR